MLDQVTSNAARSNLAPIPFEADAPFLKITGELPRELNGTLYRNGPNPQFDVPGAHWFVGDGMLALFGLSSDRHEACRQALRAAWFSAGLRACFPDRHRRQCGAPRQQWEARRGWFWALFF